MAVLNSNPGLKWLRRLVLALASVAGGLTAARAEEISDPGRLIFQGAAGATSLRLEGKALRACHSCHGRDGQGGIEGRAPPLWRPGQTAPTPEQLHRALRDRRGYDDRPLSALMPAYDLPEPALEALAAYIAAIPDEQRIGIRPRGITFAIFHTPDGKATAQAWADALRQGLRAALGPRGVYGRQPDVLLTEAATTNCPAELPQVVAVLGLPPELDGLRPCFAARAMPVLYPLSPMSAAQAASDSSTRTLLPSWEQIAQDLVADMSARGITTVVLAGGADHPLRLPLEDELALSSTLTQLPADPPPGSFDPGQTVAVRLDPGAALPTGAQPVFLPGDAPQTDEPGYSLVYDLALRETAAGSRQTLIDRHATASAKLTGRALQDAGRGLTRSGLLRAAADLSGAAATSASMAGAPMATGASEPSAEPAEPAPRAGLIPLGSATPPPAP